MNNHDEIGYNKPSVTTQTTHGKPHSKQPTSKISNEKRLEIKAWAENKAFQEAAKKGKIRDDKDYDKMREFDAWITNTALHFEKLAYLKIYNREKAEQGGKF